MCAACTCASQQQRGRQPCRWQFCCRPAVKTLQVFLEERSAYLLRQMHHVSYCFLHAVNGGNCDIKNLSRGSRWVLPASAAHSPFTGSHCCPAVRYHPVLTALTRFFGLSQIPPVVTVDSDLAVIHVCLKLEQPCA
jgi:hypothetical protein